MARDEVRRIRALLAKADSTTFPAEAHALRAKAHELMQRHGISPSDVEVALPRPTPRPAWRGAAWSGQPVRIIVDEVDDWSLFRMAFGSTSTTSSNFTWPPA